MTELDALQDRLAALGRPYTPADVAAALRELGAVVTDATVADALSRLRLRSRGTGPLEDLLATPGVTDVVVNGPRDVYMDRGRGLERTGVEFIDEDQVRRTAQRLAAVAGRRLDDASPFVDGRLPGGVRLHAALAPVAAPGTCLSLRIPAARALTLDDMVSRGAVARQGAELLRAVVLRRLPYLVTGGTGSGKTTLLGALLAEVPADERIVLVEDSRELVPGHPHCVRLEGRPANAEGVGAITLTTLVRQALRMRPDRLVVGEVRGAELADLLAALNTGHEGGCGTLHANSVGDVPARLEALAALGGLPRAACHAQIAAALRVVIHVRRGADGARGVDQIGLVDRTADGLVRVVPAVRLGGGVVEYLEGGAALRELVAP